MQLGKVEAAYRRGDLFDKRRRLMAEWATYCNTPEASGRDKVIAMGVAGRRARAFQWGPERDRAPVGGMADAPLRCSTEGAERSRVTKRPRPLGWRASKRNWLGEEGGSAPAGSGWKCRHHSVTLGA
jgi:hypothetical protein